MTGPAYAKCSFDGSVLFADDFGGVLRKRIGLRQRRSNRGFKFDGRLREVLRRNESR